MYNSSPDTTAEQPIEEENNYDDQEVGIKSTNDETASLVRKNEKDPLTDSTTDNSLWNVPYSFWTIVVLAFLVKGFDESLPSLALFYFLKDDIKASPTATASITTLSFFAWTIKPIWGYVSDRFPIAGKRRLPYIFFFSFCMSLSWLLLSLVAKNESSTVILLVLEGVASSFVNVCVEGLTVEYSHNKSFGLTSTLQTIIWGSNMASSMIAAIIGGFLVGPVGARKIFLLTCIFPLLLCISSFLGLVVFKSEADSADPPVTFSNFISEMKHVLFGRRVAWQIAIFMFILPVTPSMTSASFYFFTNELNFSSDAMACVNIIVGASGLIGITIYYLWLRNTQARILIAAGLILTTVLSLLGILLYTKANRSLGIPDFAFLVCDNSLKTGIYQATQMPLFSIIAMLSPPGLEATSFSIYTSICNMGRLVSGELGALLTMALGVTDTNFKNIWALCLICGLLQLLPIFALGLIPGGRPEEMQFSKDVDKEEEPNNAVAVNDSVDQQSIDQESIESKKEK